MWGSDGERPISGQKNWQLLLRALSFTSYQLCEPNLRNSTQHLLLFFSLNFFQISLCIECSYHFSTQDNDVYFD